MNKLRLHLGCGDVYLEGYVNIDSYREGYSYLARDRPDLVEVIIHGLPGIPAGTKGKKYIGGTT